MSIDTDASDDVPPDRVDWAALWDEFGFSHDEFMSRTQLKLALEASDEVSATIPAANTPEDGHAPDGLVARWATADPAANASVDVLRGYALAKEVRRVE